MGDLSEAVARNARMLRAGRRLRQRDVAERGGISRSTLSMIEAGGRRITVEDVAAVCLGLDVGIRDLLVGADPELVLALRLDG